jgi:hypothetical protein
MMLKIEGIYGKWIEEEVLQVKDEFVVVEELQMERFYSLDYPQEMNLLLPYHHPWFFLLEKIEMIWRYCIFIIHSVLIVIDRGWRGIDEIFSWWAEEILIDFGRDSYPSNVFVNDECGGDDGPRLSIVILDGRVLKW